MGSVPARHRILVIAHHFPPSTVAATFRPLRFVRYLPELGHDVWVLTVSAKSYRDDRIDWGLMEDIPSCVNVKRIPNPNPLRAYEKRKCKQNAGSIESSSGGHSNSGSRRLRTFLAELAKFPDQDGAWIALSLLPALRLIERNKIDLIISSAPPFGAHILALLLKKLTGRPWVAQFGNPWTGNPSISWNYGIFDKCARWFDRKIAMNADVIFGIDEILIDCIRSLGRIHNIYLQPNGYDPAHYSPTDLPCGKFTVTYTGSLYNMHDPKVIYEALNIIQCERPDIRNDMKIVFAGPSAGHEMGRGAPVDLEFTGPLPHARIIAAMNASHLLLDFLTANESMRFSTSCKIYEYMAAKRPILAAAPDGMLAVHIRELNLGKVVSPDSAAEIANALIGFYESYKQGTLRIPDNPRIEQYSAPVQAREFMRVVDAVCFDGSGETSHQINEEEAAHAVSADSERRVK